MSEKTLNDPREPLQCAACGQYYNRKLAACPHCVLEETHIVQTKRIDRPPTIVPAPSPNRKLFDSSAPILLQFLPTGICRSMSVQQPVTLGRQSSTTPDAPESLLDLNYLNAQQHGVSRRHCLLRPQGNRLVVIDLSSTNGTHLNDQSLEPYTEYTVQHGDRLILGTLHLMVFFGSV